MQCYLADHVTELLDFLKVCNDGVAIRLGQRSDCSEQCVGSDLFRVLPIDLIRQTALPSIKILPQHVRWRAAQKSLEIEGHTTAPPLATDGVVARTWWGGT